MDIIRLEDKNGESPSNKGGCMSNKIMVCPDKNICKNKKMWHKPIWKKRKEPHDDFPGVQIGENVVPQGHCIAHKRCNGCDIKYNDCPVCIEQ